MTILLILSLFWICYGILGLLGIQNIPAKYKNTEQERDYKKYSGTGWLLLGCPWLIAWALVHGTDISPVTVIFVLIISAVPAIVYSYINGKKFKKG